MTFQVLSFPILFTWGYDALQVRNTNVFRFNVQWLTETQGQVRPESHEAATHTP